MLKHIHKQLEQRLVLSTQQELEVTIVLGVDAIPVISYLVKITCQGTQSFLDDVLDNFEDLLCDILLRDCDFFATQVNKATKCVEILLKLVLIANIQVKVDHESLESLN